MQLTSLLAATICAFSQVATAYPASGQFTACTDPQFSGQCWVFPAKATSCYNFNPNFQDKMSAYRSPAGWDCTVYAEPNCKRSRRMIGLPGGVYVPDLSRSVFKFDNANRSFRCGVGFQPFNTVAGDSG